MTEQPGAVVADAGYRHTRQIEQVTERGLDVLVPPDGGMREGNRPGWENGLYELMRRKLKTERGHKLYKQRKITIEPVYGQIKYNRRIDHFMRKRQIRSAVGVAVSGSNPQSAEASQPLDSQHRLTQGSARKKRFRGTAQPEQTLGLSAFSDSLPRTRSSASRRPA